MGYVDGAVGVLKLLLTLVGLPQQLLKRLVVALSRGLSAVLGFLARLKWYSRENWGAPFILGFMGSLLTAVVLLIVGLPWTAEAVGNVAYFSLVAGVVLQLVCFWRRGSDGRSNGEGEAG